MSGFKRENAVNFVKARKAQQTAELAAGDVSTLQTQITSLQSQFTTLSNDLLAAQNTIATLQSDLSALQSAYAAHTHAYTDVDNTGATLNKTTGTPA